MNKINIQAPKTVKENDHGHDFNLLIIMSYEVGAELKVSV